MGKVGCSTAENKTIGLRAPEICSMKTTRFILLATIGFGGTIKYSTSDWS
jgi:hypothetical protein